MRFVSAQDNIVEALKGPFEHPYSFEHPHFAEILNDYQQSGLAPPNLVSELLTHDLGKVWSHLWEAMLFRHLSGLRHSLSNRSSARGQDGPDFSFQFEGKQVWVEAVVPAPGDISVDWLSPPTAEIRVREKPDRERVLRCTSCISDKQKKFANYQTRGIVGPDDITVIAVNICRLSDWDIDGCGISQSPLVMEALFPIGPIAVPITKQGRQDGPAINIPRFNVEKPNGTSISTANFLDPAFANVSAVVQAHQRYMDEKELALALVHNPLATNQLNGDCFGATKRFTATRRDDKYIIEDIVGAGD